MATDFSDFFSRLEKVQVFSIFLVEFKLEVKYCY